MKKTLEAAFCMWACGSCGRKGEDFVKASSMGVVGRVEVKKKFLGDYVGRGVCCGRHLKTSA